MTALMVLSTLMVPALATTASAGHNPNHDLNCTPETATNPTGVGSTHTVTCTVSENPVTGNPTEVDAEIVGVNFSDETSDPDSNGTGDTGDTPQQPDFTATCTPAGGPPGTCVVSFTWTGINPGTDTLEVWIDDDQNNTTVDRDEAETQNAGANDDGQAGGNQGDISDPDDTDVVTKSWVSNLPPAATLDCDDDGAPGDEADAPASDTATNPAGEGELYTCVLFNDNGTGAGGQANNGIQDGTEAGISGVRIDAEQLGGANDPDTAAAAAGNAGSPPNNATPDANDACTTGSDGRCTYTLNPAESEVGTTQLCFWTDFDTDAVYDPNGAENDGGRCDEEALGDEGDGGAGWILTDIVQKSWQTAGTAAVLDLEPEYDANPTDADGGNTHTVTATAYDAFGAVAPNVPVDFLIFGRNAVVAPICNNVLTNAQGVATCTYADEGTNSDPIPPGQSEVDTILGCLDPAASAGFACPGGADVVVDEPELNDNSDLVQKNWFNTVPNATTMQLDIEGVTEFPGRNCGGPFETQANPNPVGSSHATCVEIRDQNGQPLVGQQVTFTITGVGDFFNDADGDGTYNATQGDTIVGKTVTTSTDQNGQAFAQLTSTQSGTSSVQATSGSLSATGSKPWQSAPLRTLDCEPETAENELNDPHTIICNAKDRAGNNVAGAQIIVTENGPATVQNGQEFPGIIGQCNYYGATQECWSFTTDNSGNIQIVLNSQTEGTTTIEAADVADINDSRGGAPTDADDECDARANEGNPGAGVGSAPGAPAGQCQDVVTKDYVQPDTQCDDGVDNDGDGFIDFGDDPGCESAADDSEAPFNEPEPTRERVSRTVNIKKDKHVQISPKNRALMIKGVVNVPGVDNHTRDLCGGNVPVKIQLRAGGEWITRKSDTTGGNFNNRQGGYVFKVLIRDVAGRYRAVATKFQISDPDTNRELTCLKAQDTRRHRH